VVPRQTEYPEIQLLDCRHLRMRARAFNRRLCAARATHNEEGIRMEAIRCRGTAKVSPSCPGTRLRAGLRPCRHAGATILLASALALLLAVAGPVAAAPAIATDRDAGVSSVSKAAEAKVTLFSDGFEGAWLWSGSTWGITSLNSNGGTHSASSYVNATSSFHDMQAGPFDLSNATQAALEYDVWYDMGAGGFCYGYSTNGTSFSLPVTLTGSSDWTHQQVSLSQFVGQPRVWIMFHIFPPFSTPPGYQGHAFVDNVVVWATIPDATPPTTTVTGCDEAWHNTSVTVSLSATDNAGGSGVAATYYTIDGVQQTYTAPFAVSAAGSHTITYWSTDAAGNEETHHSGFVKIDTTVPATTVAGLQANGSIGWINHSQTVTLTPTDAGGSGVAATYYTIAGVQQTYTAPFAVSAAGSHTITYWSTDAAGNEETHHSGYVNIDTGKPTAQATKNVTVKKGKKAKLTFRISDPAPSCGTASVTITIKLKKKTVKTIKIANVAANKAGSYTFKVTLKRGSYNWTVKATDIAGNAGKASATKKLIVK
jgi:hypothetical protein